MSALLGFWRDDGAPPPGSVIVTVDDGYADFADVAAPIFAEFEIPVTAFVVSEFVSQRLWLWYDALRYLLEYVPAGRYHVNSEAIKCDIEVNGSNRSRLWSSIADKLLHISTSNRYMALDELQNVFGMELPAVPTPEFAAMTWDTVRALDGELVEFGCHTRTHPILTTCTDHELKEEINGSKADIERQLGRDIATFCYPNGQRRDFDDRSVKVIEQAGFECAVTAYGGAIRTSFHKYKLPRVPVPETMSMFKNMLSGITDIKRRLLGE